MRTHYYIGTSGWHYDDWIGIFYPPEIKGYNELWYHAKFFNTVENNSSFYRIAGESTYKTWYRMTPDNYTFSMKLNRIITHFHKLTVDDEVQKRVAYILETTQVLKEKLGAIVIQLPASFTYDLKKLNMFFKFFVPEVKKQRYSFDITIEFRNKDWFTNEVFSLLKKNNVGLVAGQSSRYPLEKHVTADFVYIRMHGPDQLFASKYSSQQLEEWAEYIKNITPEVKKVYIYFNNDYHGYAIENAKELTKMLGVSNGPEES
jgi:uncharacterized protein YecE (DUF72 family)